MPYEILPPTDQPSGGGRYEILPPAGPSKEDVQGAMLRRMGPTPFGITPDVVFGARAAHESSSTSARADRRQRHQRLRRLSTDSTVNGVKSAYDSAYQPEAFPGLDWPAASGRAL
jgi:hypothetical protein